MRSWGARHWTVAGLAALATALVVAVPTAVLPNPLFSREIPLPWWGYPALAAIAVLTGLVCATYVRTPGGAGGRRASAGAVLGFLAVGCPVCNKLVLLTLGYSGALTWFAPAQPALAGLAVVALAAALRLRLRTAAACPLPARPASRGVPRSPGATDLHPAKETS